MTSGPTSVETVLQGTAVSPGIAIAPVHVIARGFSAPEVFEIGDDEIAAEQQRFREALGETRRQLDRLQERINGLSGDREAKIFEAHLMLLEDRMLISKVDEAITTRHQNAEYAFYAVMQTFLEAMRRVNDPYLRERTIDIDDICQRVLRNLRSQPEHRHHAPEDQHVVVAYDLSPSDTAAMNRRLVLGFATELGSVTSHTAILARSLGLPAVVGMDQAVLDVQALTLAILDGYAGKLILNPRAETLAEYRDLQQRKKRARREIEAQPDAEAITTDGRAITLSANVEFAEEVPQVVAAGARGIGLYRTEFLLLGGEEMPDEMRQAEVYTAIARGVAPYPVIIRTLDAGGDKLPAEPLVDPEPNPFLGWRGIRVSLSRPAMFKEQLRAVLRASARAKVAVMFPLVSGYGEVIESKRLLHQCMDELDRENVPFDHHLDVGIMVEVPSAAMMTDLLAKEVDFFSIGTNDLVQYTLAVDRVNHHVADLYRPTNPAVIRLIKRTIDASHAAGIWTGICGEMAGDLTLIPLLIGLGVDELSVGTHLVAPVRHAIRSLNHAECAAMAAAALERPLSAEIRALSVELARRGYQDLLD
jgi:phosphotransferase system enzyme I (PtsI)